MGTDGTPCIQASRQGSQRNHYISGLLLPPKGRQALPGILGPEPEGSLHLTVAALWYAKKNARTEERKEDVGVEGEKDLEGSQNPLPKRWRKTEILLPMTLVHCLRPLMFK